MTYGHLLKESRQSASSQKRVLLALPESLGSRAGQLVELKMLTYSLYGPVVDFSEGVAAKAETPVKTEA